MSSIQSKQKHNIALAKPFFDGSELPLIEEALNSGWVTQGPKIAAFEEAMSAYVGSKHAVASSNCTTAMHLAWLINGVGAGDEVICPSYSFIASANAIRHAGAEPIFVDINEDTLNIDPHETQKCIENLYDKNLVNKISGRKLKAVLIVHQIGIPCEIDRFESICSNYGIKLVEDAACAIGSSYKGKKIGGSGNIAAFSFHPRKVISTGEGGMLTLDDCDLAALSRVYRAHGMSLSDLQRHQSGSTTFESYNVVGYNYRMTDLQAAIGISQLKSLPMILKRRNEIAEYFNQQFRNSSKLKVVQTPEYVSNWNRQSYHLTLTEGSVHKRNQLMDYLQSCGISTRRGIPPIHKEPVYESGLKLPVTEQISQSSFFIPIYPQLTNEELEHIANSVLEGVELD